jgi:hypothetical protein
VAELPPPVFVFLITRTVYVHACLISNRTAPDLAIAFENDTGLLECAAKGKRGSRPGGGRKRSPAKSTTPPDNSA